MQRDRRQRREVGASEVHDQHEPDDAQRDERKAQSIADGVTLPGGNAAGGASCRRSIHEDALASMVIRVGHIGR